MPRALLVLIALLAALAPQSAAAALPYVAIDPGHGGEDTGAVGTLPAGFALPTGLPPQVDDRGLPAVREKDVNLDIAFRLDRWLRARGHRTLLTRTIDAAGGDRPYTTAGADLRARTDIANEAGVDLFVSVHNNALGPTTSGTETFRFYVASPAARALAGEVQRTLVERLGLPDRGVKVAGFYVLRHTVMPAVLVEGAFLSNPDEAALLATPEVRQAMAEAIGLGVARYAARPVTAPAPPRPTVGPWRVRPRSVPEGYRLVRTGKRNPTGRGGWLAVVATFRPAGAAPFSR